MVCDRCAYATLFAKPKSKLTMRNSIALIGILLFIWSCQKQPMPLAMTNEDPAGPTKAWPQQIAGERQMKFLYVSNWPPGEHQCFYPGTNCSKVSFLSNQEADILRPVLYAVSSGIQDSIVEAFRQQEAALSTFMIQWDIDAVIAEQIIATTFASGGIDHLVLTSETYADTCVYRLKFP